MALTHSVGGIKCAWLSGTHYGDRTKWECWSGTHFGGGVKGAPRFEVISVPIKFLSLKVVK